MKALIVNADDFGRSAAINRGVTRAHEAGIVTSASLMVRWSAAGDAAAYARAHPRLSIGLHLDLGEWACRDGAWHAVYSVVDPKDAASVAAEIDRQLRAFDEYLERPPTHLDSHQHVHLDEPARTAVLGIARELDVPVRRVTPGVTYRGDFYGQTGEGAPFPEGITRAALTNIVDSLPDGVTELACHPGLGELESPYGRERDIETAILCDAAVSAAVRIAGVELRSFDGLCFVPRL